MIDAIAMTIPMLPADEPNALATASIRLPASPPISKLTSSAEMMSAKNALSFNAMIIPSTLPIPMISNQIGRISGPLDSATS